MSENIYKGISTNSSFGMLSRSGRHPLIENTVQISLSDLENYIKDNLTAYPGMLIAIDDDMTSGGINVDTSQENNRGIYYITRDRKNNNDLVAIKLAYKNDLDSTVNDSVEPIVQILNIMLKDDCPWEDLYDNQGRITDENTPVVSISNIQFQALNGRTYQITPIITQNDDA